MEKIVKEINLHFQLIHQINANVSAIVQKAKETLPSLGDCYAELSQIVPPSHYWKYNDMWKFVNQQVCFLCALAHYLEHSEAAPSGRHYAIITLPEIEKMVGVDKIENFHLELEEYLFGLCNLPSELSRLCVNAVTRGDYKKPLYISEFVTELHAGFGLLNLKNDALRKRFDGIKYDVKKIEEVVYDISVRGLLKDTTTAAATTQQKQ
eukprot:GEZU01009893.1.p1 GENE.GEZU01009893.1~~GEZU01009893.1.p1  ORF type:complete len:208 (-),score=58.17 GEZU01009893.1:37-660(-)